MTIEVKAKLDLSNEADNRTRASCYLRKLAFKYYILSHFLGDSTLQDFLQPWILLDLHFQSFICIWPFPKEQGMDNLVGDALHLRTSTRLFSHNLTLGFGQRNTVLISPLVFALTKLFWTHTCGKTWCSGNNILFQGKGTLYKGKCWIWIFMYSKNLTYLPRSRNDLGLRKKKITVWNSYVVIRFKVISFFI